MAIVTVNNSSSKELVLPAGIGLVHAGTNKSFNLSGAELENVQADLTRLASLGLVTFSVESDSTVNDQLELAPYGKSFGRVRRAVAQSIATATLTPVQFDTQDQIIGGLTYSTSTWTFTVGTAGLYDVAASCGMTLAAGVGVLEAQITVNGTGVQSGIVPAAAAATDVVATAVYRNYLNAGDVVGLSVKHTSTGSINTSIVATNSARLALTHL